MKFFKCSSSELLCCCCCCFHCCCFVCVCTNFFRGHLKILDAERVTWSVYHTDDAPTLDAKCKIFCHLVPRICAPSVCVCTHVCEVCTHTQINLRTYFKSVTSHQIVEWKVNMNDWMDIFLLTSLNRNHYIKSFSTLVGLDLWVIKRKT